MRIDVLEEFAEARRLAKDIQPLRYLTADEFGDELRQSTESYRRAYRERQSERGECISCPRHRSGTSRYCESHRQRAAARARASKARRAA